MKNWTLAAIGSAVVNILNEVSKHFGYIVISDLLSSPGNMIVATKRFILWTIGDFPDNYSVGLYWIANFGFYFLLFLVILFLISKLNTANHVADYND